MPNNKGDDMEYPYLHIKLQREVDGKIHTTTIKGHYQMHNDLMDKLINKLVKSKVSFDPDELMDSRIE